MQTCTILFSCAGLGLFVRDCITATASKQPRYMPHMTAGRYQLKRFENEIDQTVFSQNMSNRKVYVPVFGFSITFFQHLSITFRMSLLGKDISFLKEFEVLLDCMAKGKLI
jgi:hypothetical protein